MSKNISKDIQENLNYILDLLKDCDDLIIRELEIGEVLRVKMAIVYIDGLINKEFISEYAIGSLIKEEELKSFTLQGYRTTILEVIKEEVLATSEIEEESQWDNIIKLILSGDTLLLIDNAEKAIIIGSRSSPTRGVDEPKTESVIRGPREGFTEVLKYNTTLIRRKIRDPKLKVKIHSIGGRAKTDIAVMYIEDIVDDKLLNEVKNRLEKIDIDAILDSSILEHLIEDNYLSPFPQIENTERPDSVAAAIYEGRIALVVDNSPFALIIPATLGTLLQSSEDYYTRWIEASAVRLLRIFAIMLIILPSPLYVAITAYHPGLLPTRLIYYLASSRINVPFPAVVEAITMELTMELLRESGTRISGPIGNTIGIVGGLIIGQAAVEAGIVSPLMIIIIAISTIATFAIPSYELSAAFRLVKFLFIALAAVLGLYGIMLGLIIVGTHVITLNSFGIPFTSPYSGLGIEEGDLKDTLVKAPVQRLWMRPGFTHPKDKKRMKRGYKDE
jgi:spore germination protein